MGIKSDSGVYTILEENFRRSKDPLTCRDLWEKDSRLKKFAPDANRISDYLGHMWRKGLLQRWHAPASSVSLSRFAYTWKEQVEKLVPVPNIKSLRTKTIKPNCTITEDEDRVVLDFELFTITVQRKE